MSFACDENDPDDSWHGEASFEAHHQAQLDWEDCFDEPSLAQIELCDDGTSGDGDPIDDDARILAICGDVMLDDSIQAIDAIEMCDDNMCNDAMYDDGDLIDVEITANVVGFNERTNEPMFDSMVS